MTIPEQAVQVAIGVLVEAKKNSGWPLMEPNSDTVAEMLTAAAPHLAAVRVNEQPNITRPIVGIENRTAQEVFDIMRDRILSALEPSAGRAAVLEEAARLDAATAALISLTEAGIPTDVQELLIVGDPSRGIAPGSLSKAIATVIRALASHPVVDNTQCERCQGNGEIVTDWERYKHPHENDVGDEAVAECPDCNGYGYAEAIAHPVADKPDEAGAQGNGWQPIESAPKDGKIDIWATDNDGKGRRVTDCYYDRICDEWRTSAPALRLHCVKPRYVTHWRPLPTPPSSEVA